MVGEGEVLFETPQTFTYNSFMARPRIHTDPTSEELSPTGLLQLLQMPAASLGFP